MLPSPLIPGISRDAGDSVTADGLPRAAPYAGRVEQVYTWLRCHPLAVDGPLAAALLALSVFSSDLVRSSGSDQARDIAISLLLAGPVLVRRKHPTAAFAVTVATATVLAALGTRSGAPSVKGASPAVLVLLYTLAAHRPRRISLRGLLACLAAIAVGVISFSEPLASLDTAWTALGLGVPVASVWIFGDSVANRRAHNAWLDERARRAEAERDTKAQLAAAAERSRIAREMHDIIAHNLAVIVGLADGGRYAAARSPERASQALGAIASTGREALSELRRLLGVLTEDDDQAADLAPQPGLADLEALLDRVRAAGLPVTCTMQGDPAGLSEGQQLTVYRIVQEALTNTLKHAGPAATAEVILGYADRAVDVQVTDTGIGTAAGSPDGDGKGLHGMRERVAVYDGTLQAGPASSGGGWRVTAHLPAPEPMAAAS
jgi:signal transduction histidine kinase